MTVRLIREYLHILGEIQFGHVAVQSETFLGAANRFAIRTKIRPSKIVARTPPVSPRYEKLTRCK